MTKILEKEYKAWLDNHLNARRGERKRRLADGHRQPEREFAKKIWWLAFGHFKYLHPEYEVKDFFDGVRYLDFAYIRGPIRIAIEIDGYGTHLTKISRRQFCDQWVRHMHLLNDNWIVVRIGYDDIAERPRLWIQLLQQMIGRLFGDEAGESNALLTAPERDIVRLCHRLNRPVKLADVKAELGCGYVASRKHLRSLEAKNILVPASGMHRVTAWQLTSAQRPLIL